MTDVTGFGFIGHLLEMLFDNNLTAIIHKNKVPIIEKAKTLAQQFVFPDNTTRNYKTQVNDTEGMTDLDFIFYCDPQTSGGLLFTVNKAYETEMDAFLQSQQQFFAKVGEVVLAQEKKIVFY